MRDTINIEGGIRDENILADRDATGMRSFQLVGLRGSFEIDSGMRDRFTASDLLKN